jgi:hypothetical protein
MERCEECGTKLRGEGRTTPFGRRVCADCSDKIVGPLMGLQADSAGMAAAGPGLLRWIRGALKRS